MPVQLSNTLTTICSINGTNNCGFVQSVAPVAVNVLIFDISLIDILTRDIF